jgi:hypothetical protein
MDDANKQNLSWAQFQALRSHPPSSWDERTVSRFHEIVTALEDAYGVGLSPFRIPDVEMKRNIVGVSRIGYSGRRRSPQLSTERYCDESFARRQMEGIAFYFQNLQPPPERQKIGF